MSQHLVYGLLYIILLPFAALFGLSALMYLLLATQMPLLLIVSFIMACFVIYTVATLVFYVKGIQQQKPCKPSLRDWIRVNTFVIIVPAFLFFVNGIAVLTNPTLIQDVMSQFKEMQGQQMPFSVAFIKIILGMLLVYGTTLLIHIIYTFRLLKKYNYVFGFADANEKE